MQRMGMEIIQMGLLTIMVTIVVGFTLAALFILWVFIRELIKQVRKRRND